MTETPPPEIVSPLAVFKGAEPAAPAWFEAAVAHEPERFMVEVKGCAIECLVWGDRGKPGLILVHGASAHADWWSFIAPFFAQDYRVAALSLSGMGGSGWRPHYDFATFGDEIDACARAAGLFESGQPPVYIGHSFGGAVVYIATLAHPERMRATIMVDSGFRGPQPDASASDAAKADVAPARKRPSGRIYRTLEEALARFRFMPPQEPNNLFITDFIARRSLKRAPLEDGGDGWTWKFDPDLFPRLDPSPLGSLLGNVLGPTAHICGDRSKVITWEDGRPKFTPPSVKTVIIPDCDHHVMVDQPLALVTAIRGVLAYWPA
jgi:pimeloyl-ACP methyl ester carboxylesterase